MPKNPQAPDPGESLDARPFGPSASSGVTRFTLPEPLSKEKAAYVAAVQKKIQKLGLPGMLSSARSDIGRTLNVFVVDCGACRPLPPQQTARPDMAPFVDGLMLDLANKLDGLHRRQILFLSLAPSCVLVDAGEGSPSCALCGFLDAVDLTRPYSGRTGLYAPDFAAPEAKALTEGGKAALTAASDVFSLGLTYHLYLTGALPETQPAAEDGALRLSSQLDIPHRSLLSRMLARDPSQRLQTMEDAAAEIRRILSAGGCFVRIDCPDLANRFVVLSDPHGDSFRKKLDQNGQAVIGPLLSDQEYAITVRGKEIFRVQFPKTEQKQFLHLSSDAQLSETPTVEKQAPQALLRRRKTKLDLLKEDAREAILLKQPLNNICRIDILNDHYCLLTLTNGGSFWIRTEAAPRYGIGHLVKGKRGE